MKIAITGAMGVGKTTLAKQISKEIKYHMIPEVARVMAENGHQLDTDATPDTELKIAEYQQRLENGYKNWVADRCLVDVLAYSMILFPEDDKLLNEINDKLCQAEYDIILYIPAEFPIEEDGVRNTDESFQKRIEDTIKLILLPGDFNPKTYIMRGTREERLQKALSIIKEKNNENS